jgi:antitoxin component YwqK of YwqJK toxin-antitoxin module
MKILFLFLPICLYVQQSYSQDFNKVYFNSNWEITSQKSCVYYRTSGFNNKTLVYDGRVTDYYMDGSIEMTGQYENGVKEGDFLYYDQNHNIMLKSSYDHNNRSGIWTEYYSNGKIKREVNYENGKEKLIALNDETGKNKIKEGNQRFSYDYYYNSHYDSYSEDKLDSLTNKCHLKGKLVNGYKDGTWILQTEYRTICKAKYDNGKFLNGEYFLFYDMKTPIESDIFTYLIIEPGKIKITESFFKEAGQMIRLNYVLKALQASEKQPDETVELINESDLIDYFKTQYSIYVKSCTDTFRITLKLDVDNLGKLTIDTITPNIPTSMTKEAYRVINSISNLKMLRNKKLSINYRVLCLDELDFKK